MSFPSAAPIETEEAPSTPDEWTTAIVAGRLQGLSIYDENLKSASKFQFRQFLLLRVLWKAIPIASFKPEQFGLQEWIKPAKQMLNEYHSWKVYRDSFQGRSGEGNFFLARSYQLDAAKVQSLREETDIIISPIAGRTRAKLRERHPAPDETPTKSTRRALEKLQISDALDDVPLTPGLESEDSQLDSSTPPLRLESGKSDAFWEESQKTEDEQIVNTALINYLKAITEHFPSISSSWTIHRKAYKAKFHTTEYEARTDGYLRGKSDSDARALIEVKASLRKRNLLKIRMQESAQMVAWLKESSYPPRDLPYRRVHVSQDRHQIWLTFAEYDNRYLEYLNGKHKAHDPPSFLTMYEVGPYSTLDELHMVHLAPILLALALRADYDQQKAQGCVGQSR